jgi:hypothetical protein
MRPVINLVSARDAAIPAVIPTKAKRAPGLIPGLILELILWPSLARAQHATPRVFLLDAKQLQATRERIKAGDQTLAPALDKLNREAQQLTHASAPSVTTKQVAPPSGDKHDYMSQAPYFWPDPSKPNGLPYIRRDGERNPEINKISDHQSMDQMVAGVETLALAYYLKGGEAYAVHARRMLLAWFLDPATRMNPNLEYAQGIPGVSTGRGIGLIETRGLARVVDAVGLLAGSKAWTAADQRGLEDWFSRFLKWMLESRNGRDEAASKNNHGTFYDVQVVSYALFTGNQGLAARVLQEARQKRIAVQVEPDGRQPLELERTRSWSYSVMNLEGLMQLALLGRQAGVDLWNFQSSDGRGIRKALDFLAPFALGERKWSHQQLGDLQPQALIPSLRLASNEYREAQYASIASRLAAVNPSDRRTLLTP